jgi:hypothetical protein
MGENNNTGYYFMYPKLFDVLENIELVLVLNINNIVLFLKHMIYIPPFERIFSLI